ncbi:DUF3237 domain-containing protein [Kushneria phosphatilytica]|uniref:DUF3237 domain-containing protein n=1 Tax=Kushneria phosphatilytica TaxID=657387 RepID=A0A1S1NZG9_9GAMM|nr:DUF3237 domain-containing protein [Kushneria phosphatilytica]OHV13916.1 hypothetical protein BH688_00785 [Kushneria phosphatilytica]QEL10477.1 DUF3237 domain-containing protein [Kushneria phosphatilytica]
MSPALQFSFRIDITVDTPTRISNDPIHGKRQLIPILNGQVSGAIEGRVLPGGVDSQIIDRHGLCRLSARYAVETREGERFYIENNGIRRIPHAWRERLFDDDMSFFNDIPPEEIYFRAVPTFEVYGERLRWLTEHLFVCSGRRTANGVFLEMYRVL